MNLNAGCSCGFFLRNVQWYLCKTEPARNSQRLKKKKEEDETFMSQVDFRKKDIIDKNVVSLKQK